MNLKSSVAVAATSVVVLAGCGSDNATDTARRQAKSAETQAQDAGGKDALSSQSQQVLEQAQALAGDVGTTAKAYANQDITRDNAMTRLDGYQKRAQALEQSARKVPETDQARTQLTQLTQQLIQTVTSLRSTVSSNTDPKAAQPRVQSSIDALRKSATGTYQRLQDRLPADSQQRIDDALGALGS
jgi:hypothetical protein